MKLINQSRGNVAVATSVEVANSFYSRLMGLMFKPSMAPDSAMWFPRCNSVQTTFMRFAIDVVYVDKSLKVKRVYENLKPWRVTRFVFGADSAFELPVGSIQKGRINVGDQLYVGD